MSAGFSYSSLVLWLTFFASLSTASSFSRIAFICVCASWSRRSAASRSHRAWSTDFQFNYFFVWLNESENIQQRTSYQFHRIAGELFLYLLSIIAMSHHNGWAVHHIVFVPVLHVPFRYTNWILSVQQLLKSFAFRLLPQYWDSSIGCAQSTNFHFEMEQMTKIGEKEKSDLINNLRLCISMQYRRNIHPL